MNTRTSAQIFEELERIANILPSPVYWLDINGINLGINDVACMKLGGLDVRNNILGKDHNSYYPKDIADILTENNRQVVKLGKTIEFEERVVNIKTKEIQYFTSIRSPLRDDEGNIIGIIGTSIEITDRKEKEKLKIENEIQKEKLNELKRFNKFIDNIQREIKAYQLLLLKSKIDKNTTKKDTTEHFDIKLTEREQITLYFLSLNKSSKEIANIISVVENKKIEPTTIASIINKQLYPKLEVTTTSELIEKASLYKLLPFIPDDFFDKAKNKNNALPARKISLEF